MTSQPLLIAFVVFAIVMFITPGPNNIMLLASGLNFGFRRTLPHLAGVVLGFAFMIAVTGLGLGAVFTTYPVLHTVLKYAGAAYLVYLAVAIARSGAPDPDAAARRRPMTFLGAALFQWVNVKGWVMVIGTITAYAAIAGYPWNILLQVALSLLIGFVSCVAWVLCGTALQTLVKSPRAINAFNIVMALLLLASLYPVLVEP
ncbi:MAG: lysine transporter LysE [Tardiphaga sp.]|uniref:LysE family translocator n=1 Tax=Tardiphaga sp. TaxID=1926292 RepID=UPI002631E556|nr:LysE family translocator [Tardiphaga sp.]MDB5501813.1 lysine transporter LysE [Tardiphaga sp.]